MHTDRRIYFTTAIVAIVVGLAISFLARSDPFTAAVRAPTAAPEARGAGVLLREAQSTQSKAGRDQPAANWVDFSRVPLPPEMVRVASADARL